MAVKAAGCYEIMHPYWADTAMATELQNQLNPTLVDLNQRIAEIKGTNLAKHYKQLHVPS
jgi:hypothetical protein